QSAALAGDVGVRLQVDVGRLNQMRDKSAGTGAGFLLAPMGSGAPPMGAAPCLWAIRIFCPNTQFVIGSMAGRSHEQPLPLPDVVMLGGTVRGVPDSNVFLSISPFATNGFVRLGQRMQVISSGQAGESVGTFIYDSQSLPTGTIRW